MEGQKGIFFIDTLERPQYKVKICMLMLDYPLLLFAVKVPTMQADIESARQHITEDGRLVSKTVQVQERLGASLSEGKSLLHTMQSPNNGKVLKQIIRTNKTTAGILGEELY